jgi:F-type H+-transporting ATPase subunit delta
VEEIAEVYARSLFEVARERDVLDDVHEQLGQFAQALQENREMAIFLFSPHFSAQEKKDGLRRTLSDVDETFMNFLEALIERHRMPATFRIREDFERLWDEERKLLPVSVTTAVELDDGTVQSIGRRIGEQSGRRVELSSHVDPDILGGIVLRVGNLVLDASIRHRLDQLRKQVAQV